MKKFFQLILLLFISYSAIANTTQEPLPVDQAFTLSAELFGQDTVVLTWKMAPEHYLYRDRFHFKILKPTDSGIGQILFPASKPKEDKIFGKYEVYENAVTLPIPIIHPDLQNTVLEVEYQGCAEGRYCYPPATRTFQIDFSQGTISAVAPLINNTDNTEKKIPSTNNTQEQPFLDIFADHNLATLLLAFLGFGVLLSLTPCVLPMVPILSGIIIGHQKTMMRGKIFRLSLVYVLSMAFTYAIAGVLIGWLGGSVQSLFQKPWVLILSSFIFVLLALSFFGLYSLRLPARFEERIANLSRHQKSGHYLGVAVMGCLATLIVSPCVTPALVGVLGYISKTGDAALGGLALFTMGLGMGTPLLAIGIAGNKLLPKAGPWMTKVEYIFGVLFLGMAIWMLNRLIPAHIILMLWASLLIVCSVYLGALSLTPSDGWGKLWKGVGLLFLTYGILLAIGAAQGNSNPLQPISATFNTASTQNTLSFTPVKSLADVEAALARAKSENKRVLLDFHAAWCIACQEMELSTFKDPKVVAALNNFILLKADITANDVIDKQLMQHFQVIAPPTFLLFDGEGKLSENSKRVGKLNAEEFLAYIK